MKVCCSDIISFLLTSEYYYTCISISVFYFLEGVYVPVLIVYIKPVVLNYSPR